MTNINRNISNMKTSHKNIISPKKVVHSKETHKYYFLWASINF